MTAGNASIHAAASAAQREPGLEEVYSDQASPIGIEGVEFVEYATSRLQALGQVLEMVGFRPIARHRSREVVLYRQGALNVVVNAHPVDGVHAQAEGNGGLPEHPRISAIALRVRNARAAHAYVLDRGGWDVRAQPEIMELHIPAIRAAGGSRIYFVDRHREFSVFDVDFVRIPGVDPARTSLAGIGFFGLVQYIAPWRTNDWTAFYGELFGAKLLPEDERFGIMPTGHLLRIPTVERSAEFMLQLVELPLDYADSTEGLQRIGLAVPDVAAAVRAMRALGMEFVDTRTSQRGALTKTYLGSVAFELVLQAAP